MARASQGLAIEDSVREGGRWPHGILFPAQCGFRSSAEMRLLGRLFRHIQPSEFVLQAKSEDFFNELHPVATSGRWTLDQLSGWLIEVCVADVSLGFVTT